MNRSVACLLLVLGLVAWAEGASGCVVRCDMDCCKSSDDATIGAARDCCQVQAATTHTPTPAATAVRSASAAPDAAALVPIVATRGLLVAPRTAPAARPDDDAPPGTVPLFLLNTSLLI